MNLLDADAAGLSQQERQHVYRVWAVVICSEHLILLFRTFMKSLFNRPPTWISKARMMVTRMSRHVTETQADRAAMAASKRRARAKRQANSSNQTTSK